MEKFSNSFYYENLLDIQCASAVRMNFFPTNVALELKYIPALELNIFIITLEIC